MMFSKDQMNFGVAESGYEFFLKGAHRAPFKKNSYKKPATPSFPRNPRNRKKQRKEYLDLSQRSIAR